MQILPKTLKFDKDKGLILRKLGNFFLVGFEDDPYEPWEFYFFTDHDEAEDIYNNALEGDPYKVRDSLKNDDYHLREEITSDNCVTGGRSSEISKMLNTVQK